MPKTAGIIIIGNEILSGKVADRNSGYLAAELRALGVNVRMIAVVPDEVEAIGAAAAGFSSRFDFVFTSGGVGPTHDDVTMKGIAHGFGVGTVIDPKLAGIIQKRCGINMGEPSMKMAEVPEGAELIDLEGLSFPPVVFRNIHIFPGIPEYLKRKFAALRERFRCTPYMLRKVYLSEEECQVVEHIDRVDAEYPDVQVGSYPYIDEPEYKVIVTLESTDPAALGGAFGRLLELLPPEAVVRTEPAD